MADYVDLVLGRKKGTQAYAVNPDRNDSLLEQFGKAPTVARTATSNSAQLAQLAQLDKAKTVDRDGVVVASATAQQSADISGWVFRNAGRVSQ